MTTIQWTLTPQQAYDAQQKYRIVKRSIDARQRQLKVHLSVLADDNGKPIFNEAPIPLYTPPSFKNVANAKHTVIIIGAGPAGLFAALTLIENGVKPIIFERGKDVAERKKDIATINRNLRFITESNYCFGEGGAGTFSDGKLFSRSNKRGNMQRIMELFHFFGAADTVLYESHAHIGSDKLPSIIKRMRECIIAHGGEIHFNSCIDHLDLAYPTILATGHSALDTYQMLHDAGVCLQPKGFAMGVRVEHPQDLINNLVYHTRTLSYGIGNASYSLVTQVDGRGVYSFCMCPGGHIVPATSQEGCCVVNGMSASHRMSPFANSGIVVEIRPEDIPFIDHPLPTLLFQHQLEQLAYQHGASPNQAPAQRLKDFVLSRSSDSLPPCSYLPGLVRSRLDQWLPTFIGKRLQQGFRDFDKKYRGFITNDALILGVESRTSSPIRIVRDNNTMQSISHPMLYPVGEGAGYAGGITSSALDGIRAAQTICNNLFLFG